MKRVQKTLIVGALLLGMGSSVASAQAAKKIRIGYPSLSFRQSNVWIAKEMKLFNKYGLEVEPDERHRGSGRVLRGLYQDDT
jgi:ABC-type nitrate/sulfonate/bicarbonate transport system substrate-binding protein